MNSINRRRAFPLALACASILAAAQAAEAQQATTAAPDQELEEVVVTGFRWSLENSIELKRESIGVLESVSSEEIGKLPDVSIADALARLPGLAAQRVDGRAQVISLRGMAPKYAVTLLNGREMVSTGDNRSVEYDQFPSELITTAAVYKTQDAALMSQGLSGTVNLSTVRPLDYTSRIMTVSIRGEGNDNGELNDGYSDIGGRFSGSYVDQFADGKIGVAVGYAYLDNPGQEKYYKSWWWADTSVWDAPLPGVEPGAIALQGFEAGVTSTERKRHGLMGVLEFKPNDDLHSTVDLYYSKFDQQSTQSEMQSAIDVWDGAAYVNPVYTTRGQDTFVVGGTVNGAVPIVLSRFNDREDEIYAAGWRTDWTIGEAWTVSGDLAYSKAKRDESNSELTMKTAEPLGFSSIDVELTDSGLSHFTPAQDYSDASVVMLMEQWGRGGRSSTPKVDDEMKSAQLFANRTFEGKITSVDFGGSYSERTKNMDRGEVYYFLDDPSGMTMLNDGDVNSPANLGFAGIGNIVSVDFNRVLNAYYTSGVPAALDQQPGRRWDVTEKVSRAYAKLNFDFGSIDNGNERFRGNIGVQYVHTDQSSNGLVWIDPNLTPISGGAKYDDILPSLNVSIDLGEKTIARIGVAREMARPNMEEMRAGFSDVSRALTPEYRWSARGGNPELEPWRADAWDVSLEHYFGPRSYVAGAFFYKDLKSFVFESTIDYDFTGFPDPSPGAIIPGYGTDIPTYKGDLTTMQNGHGGIVDGIELSGVFDAGMISDALEGIGLVLSYSHTESNLHEQNNPAKSLEGLSGDVASAILYYEQHGISARISDRYRSSYESISRNQFGDNSANAIGAENIVDAQLGYDFNGGMFDGLSLLLQVLNLTDEPYRTSVGIAAGGSNPNTLMPERYNTYGRQYLVGATYKF